MVQQQCAALLQRPRLQLVIHVKAIQDCMLAIIVADVAALCPAAAAVHILGATKVAVAAAAVVVGVDVHAVLATPVQHVSGVDLQRRQWYSRLVVCIASAYQSPAAQTTLQSCLCCTYKLQRMQ